MAVSEVVEMKEVMGGGGVVANRIQALRCFGIAPRKSRTRAETAAIMSAIRIHPLQQGQQFTHSPVLVDTCNIHMFRH